MLRVHKSMMHGLSVYETWVFKEVMNYSNACHFIFHFDTLVWNLFNSGVLFNELMKWYHEFHNMNEFYIMMSLCFSFIDFVVLLLHAGSMP